MAHLHARGGDPESGGFAGQLPGIKPPVSCGRGGGDLAARRWGGCGTPEPSLYRPSVGPWSSVTGPTSSCSLWCPCPRFLVPPGSCEQTGSLPITASLRRGGASPSSVPLRPFTVLLLLFRNRVRLSYLSFWVLFVLRHFHFKKYFHCNFSGVWEGMGIKTGLQSLICFNQYLPCPVLQMRGAGAQAGAPDLTAGSWRSWDRKPVGRVSITGRPLGALTKTSFRTQE